MTGERAGSPSDTGVVVGRGVVIALQAKAARTAVVATEVANKCWIFSMSLLLLP